MRQTVVLEIPTGMKGTFDATSKYGYTPTPSKNLTISRPDLSVTVSSPGATTLVSTPIKKRLNFDATTVDHPQSTPSKQTYNAPPHPPSHHAHHSPIKLPPPQPTGTPTKPHKTVIPADLTIVSVAPSESPTTF